MTQPALLTPGIRVSINKAYPIGHCRTPFYIRGLRGTIERYCGAFANPEELAYGRPGTPPIPLYRVRILLCELWPDYAGPPIDTLEVEVFAHWLQPVEQLIENANAQAIARPTALTTGQSPKPRPAAQS